MYNLKSQIRELIAAAIDLDALLEAISEQISDYIDYDDLAAEALMRIDVNRMAVEALDDIL